MAVGDWCAEVVLYGHDTNIGENALSIQHRLRWQTVFAVFQRDRLISDKMQPYNAAPQIPRGCARSVLLSLRPKVIDRDEIVEFLAYSTPIGSAACALLAVAPADGRG